MFSPNEIKRTYYPGEEWVYLKLYMGPETSEEWICHHLPQIQADIEAQIPESLVYFIRYLDPDFHIRLRVRLQQRKQFGYLIDLVNLHSSLLTRQGLIWKIEISTYERELERYGSLRIDFFEKAFHYDTQFWIKVLPWLELQESREDLRWKLALVSGYRYYRDLIGDPEEIHRIIRKVHGALKHEQKPGRAFLYQADTKFRHHRSELEQLLEQELDQFPQIEYLLRMRSFRMQELFEPFRQGAIYFSWAGADQNMTDLVHMSFNRVLRSRHRLQEFVVYRYMEKLVATQLALR